MSNNHRALLDVIRGNRSRVNEKSLIAVENSINGKFTGKDTIGGLEFVERGDADFLDKINFNYQKLLNSSSGSPMPTTPRVGQIWFDADAKQLKIWAGSEWLTVMVETKKDSAADIAAAKALEEEALQAKLDALEAQLSGEIDQSSTEYQNLLDEKMTVVNDLESTVNQTVEQYEQLQISVLKPGTISYSSGVLNYWSLDVINYNNNTKFGVVAGVNGNDITINPDTIDVLDNLIIDKSILIFEEEVDGKMETIIQNYQVSAKNGNVITVYPLDATGERDDGITNTIAVNQTCWQAGGWKLLISDFLDKGTETATATNRQDYVNRINEQGQLITDMLSSGYKEGDRDIVIAQAWKVVYEKELILFDAIAAVSNYDENNKPQTVLDAELEVANAKKGTIVPPPSTKEIIVNTLENISLTVLGSLDIGIDGSYSNLPSVTQSGVPSYISNFGYHGTYRGTPSIKGINTTLGNNYTVIRGYYDAANGGRSDISFTIDMCKAAGLEESQRKNYKYEGFSALFKMNERNFWDYTGSQKTWQYLVNMTPLTSDPDSTDYGKYRIFCQVYAYKYYHSAQIGGRWLAIMNKYRNF